MKIMFLTLHTILQLLISCHYAYTKLLERYFIQDNIQLPIFGSFAYDPVKQDFDPPFRTLNQSQRLENGTYLSTVLPGEESTLRHLRPVLNKVVFRQNEERNSESKSSWITQPQQMRKSKVGTVYTKRYPILLNFNTSKTANTKADNLLIVQKINK